MSFMGSKTLQAFENRVLMMPENSVITHFWFIQCRQAETDDT